jgi:hypothetical protein
LIEIDRDGNVLPTVADDTGAAKEHSPVPARKIAAPSEGGDALIPPSVDAPPGQGGRG